MRFVELEGARVSVVGLGCWQFGSSDWGYGSDYARRDAGAIVERALNLGVNLVDTAEIYAYGQSERIVGEAIRGRRDDVFLATKLFPLLPLAPVVEQRAQASAHRLGVDAIDLYQVHPVGWDRLHVAFAGDLAAPSSGPGERVPGEREERQCEPERGRAAERAEGGNIFITMHLGTTRLVADVRCVPTLVLNVGAGGRQSCAGWLGDRHRRTGQFG